MCSVASTGKREEFPAAPDYVPGEWRGISRPWENLRTMQSEQGLPLSLCFAATTSPLAQPVLFPFTCLLPAAPVILRSQLYSMPDCLLHCHFCCRGQCHSEGGAVLDHEWLLPWACEDECTQGLQAMGGRQGCRVSGAPALPDFACAELSWCQCCCLAAKQRHCCQFTAKKTQVVMTAGAVRRSGFCLPAFGPQDCSCRLATRRVCNSWCMRLIIVKA